MFDSIVEAVFRHAEQSPDRLCLTMCLANMCFGPMCGYRIWCC